MTVVQMGSFQKKMASGGSYRTKGASAGGGGAPTGYGPESGPMKRVPRGWIKTREYRAPGSSKTQYWARPPLSAPPVAAPAPPPEVNISPNINVSPNVQTQVSPQISPIFQQTGSGDQSAGTSQTGAGGQDAAGGSAGGNTAELTRFLIEQEKLRARRESEYRAEMRQLELQRQQAAAANDAARVAELQRQQQERARVEEENRRITEANERAAQQAAKAAPQYVPGGVTTSAESSPTQPIATVGQSKIPMPLLIVGGLVLIGGIYYLSKKRNKT